MKKLTVWLLALVFILWGVFAFFSPMGYTDLQSARAEYATIYQTGEIVYSEENEKIDSSFDFIVKDDSLYVIRLSFLQTKTGKYYRKWGHYQIHISGLMQESTKNQAAYETERALLFHNEVSRSLTGDADAVNRAMQWCITKADCEIATQAGISSYPFSCGGEAFCLYVKTEDSVVYSRSFSAFFPNYALISLGVFIGALPFIGIVRKRQYKNLVDKYNVGEYQKVAAGAEKSIAALLRESVRKRNYDHALLVNALDERYLMLAVSRYAEGDKEGFLESIGKIQGLEAEKNLWLTIYYLIDGNLAQAETQYAVLCSIPTFEKEKTPALDGLLLLKKGDDEKALPILRNAVKSTHHPLLRRIVEQTLNSKK